MTSIRRWLHDRRVFLWLCVLTGVIAGTSLRLALVIDELRDEVDRSRLSDCDLQQKLNTAQVRSAELLVEILGRDEGATTPGGQRLVAEYAAAVAREFPTTICP